MTYSHALDRDEGFTGAFNRTPWERRFAWRPVHLTEYPQQKVWLRWIEVKNYGAFGIPQFAVRLAATERELRAEMVHCMIREKIIRERLASADTHPKGGDVQQAPAPLSGAVGAAETPKGQSHDQ